MEFGATGTLDMLGADWEAYYTYQNFHQAQVTRNYINMLAVQNAFDVEAGAGIDVTTAEPPKKSHPYYQIINHSNFAIFGCYTTPRGNFFLSHNPHHSCNIVSPYNVYQEILSPKLRCTAHNQNNATTLMMNPHCHNDGNASKVHALGWLVFE